VAHASVARALNPGERNPGLDAAFHQHLLDLADSPRGIESLRASAGAVHDRVEAIEAKWVLEIVEPLARVLVAAVGEPAIRLKQRRGSEIALGIPPITGTRSRTASSQDALIKPIELGAFFR